jgi:hypothetical protein
LAALTRFVAPSQALLNTRERLGSVCIIEKKTKKIEKTNKNQSEMAATTAAAPAAAAAPAPGTKPTNSVLGGASLYVGDLSPYVLIYVYFILWHPFLTQGSIQ